MICLMLQNSRNDDVWYELFCFFWKTRKEEYNTPTSFAINLLLRSYSHLINCNGVCKNPAPIREEL